METFWSAALSLILHLSGLIALVIVASVYVLLTILIPPRYLQWYVRIGCRFILLSCGQWLTIKGQAPDPIDGPYLYLANHSSYLDAFIVGAAIPEHFGAIAADYNFQIPGWNWAIRRYGAISIVRHKLNEAINSLKHAEEAIASGLSILIFPEGTRTLDGKLQPFKKGAFHVAKNTDVVVVPCGIRGAHKSYKRNSWLLKPGVITWVWGEPQNKIAGNYRYCSIDDLVKFFHYKISVLIDGTNPNKQGGNAND
ncbi:MAG: lysophospholipid acyltransferase family protein [Patescibacteria group bacterium]